MSDPHKRHTAQNARGLNDLITKREAYAGTRRMIDAAMDELRTEMKEAIDETVGDVEVRVLRFVGNTMGAHMCEEHTPWYVRAWRAITRRGNA